MFSPGYNNPLRRDVLKITYEMHKEHESIINQNFNGMGSEDSSNAIDAKPDTDQLEWNDLELMNNHLQYQIRLLEKKIECVDRENIRLLRKNQCLTEYLCCREPYRCPICHNIVYPHSLRSEPMKPSTKSEITLNHSWQSEEVQKLWQDHIKTPEYALSYDIMEEKREKIKGRLNVILNTREALLIQAKEVSSLEALRTAEESTCPTNTEESVIDISSTLQVVEPIEPASDSNEPCPKNSDKLEFHHISAHEENNDISTALISAATTGAENRVIEIVEGNKPIQIIFIHPNTIETNVSAGNLYDEIYVQDRPIALSSSGERDCGCRKRKREHSKTLEDNKNKSDHHKHKKKKQSRHEHNTKEKHESHERKQKKSKYESHKHKQEKSKHESHQHNQEKSKHESHEYKQEKSKHEFDQLNQEKSNYECLQLNQEKSKHESHQHNQDESKHESHEYKQEKSKHESLQLNQEKLKHESHQHNREKSKHKEYKKKNNDKERMHRSSEQINGLKYCSKKEGREQSVDCSPPPTDAKHQLFGYTSPASVSSGYRSASIDSNSSFVEFADGQSPPPINKTKSLQELFGKTPTKSFSPTKEGKKDQASIVKSSSKESRKRPLSSSTKDTNCTLEKSKRSLHNDSKHSGSSTLSHLSENSETPQVSVLVLAPISHEKDPSKNVQVTNADLNKQPNYSCDLSSQPLKVKIKKNFQTISSDQELQTTTLQKNKEARDLTHSKSRNKSSSASLASKQPQEIKEPHVSLPLKVIKSNHPLPLKVDVSIPLEHYNIATNNSRSTARKSVGGDWKNWREMKSKKEPKTTLLNLVTVSPVAIRRNLINGIPINVKDICPLVDRKEKILYKKMKPQ